MEPLQVALIDQTNDGTVSQEMLLQFAAALQQQVDNDLEPNWHVRADISVPAAGADITPGTAPLAVVSSLAGRAGVHTNFQGQLSAKAVSGDQLSITLSHELLEMLVDPSDTRFIKAKDLDPRSGGQQVYYLVEVCDPVVVYSYDIDGVPVSDFVLPSFYDPNAKGEVDFAGFVARTFDRASAGVTSRGSTQPITSGMSCSRTALSSSGPNPAPAVMIAMPPWVMNNPDRHDVPAIYRA